MKFKQLLQQDSSDCGPACLAMIVRSYGKDINLSLIRELCGGNRSGVSLLSLSDAAKSIGFNSRCVQLNMGYLIEDVVLPCIVHWEENHFVVIYRITNKWIYVADPAKGKVKYSKTSFQEYWTTTEDGEGFALLLEPAGEFYKQTIPIQKRVKTTYFIEYIKPYKSLFFQLILGLLTVSAIQLIFPFLTQIMVDKGINGKNTNLLILILAGQLMLTLSSSIVGYIQSWVVLYIGTRINVTMVYDFLKKLTRLPVSFFDLRQSGDILQRISDQSRIESFATNSFLNILIVIVNFLVFSIVIITYNPVIFLVFCFGSALYIIWILSFLGKRKIVDYDMFSKMSDNSDMIIQLIRGMHEIKLNNCEKSKIASWIKIQKQIFDIRIRSTKLNQFESAGSTFIKGLLNIIILFIAAISVINGSITFGAMLAIQYIVGQLNGPIEQVVYYIHDIQDTKISLSRVGYIYEQKDEVETGKDYYPLKEIEEDVIIENLSFRYNGARSPKVLDNINLSIPKNKTTAVVGTSGSGKTTLIKLLLGFYLPLEGQIIINNKNFKEIDINSLRDLCGIVMQEGFIFNDTIANNITLKDSVDNEKLKYSCKIANLNEFIDSLPLGFGTKVGSEGIGISSGQKQRLLIARAVYKNPSVIIFDEATNSLDANNEKIIHENLKGFFKGKTVLIVAHRLSTVKNAENIVVLKQGKLVEQGSHQELVLQRGEYYNLIKNQLELQC